MTGFPAPPCIGRHHYREKMVGALPGPENECLLHINKCPVLKKDEYIIINLAKRSHTQKISHFQRKVKMNEPKKNEHKLSTKRGYLHKWQDREIGHWMISGSNHKHWTLRFAVLDEKGKLSYYKSHLDYSPRYVLDLKGCAVQDDGSKAKVDSENDFYHVFSVYHKPKRKKNDVKDGSTNDKNDDDVDMVDENELDITPLLRFSTESLAEKNQWMDVISEACAYRDSINVNKPRVNQSLVELTPQPALPLPKAEKGRLPPIYFSQPPSKTYRRKSLRKTSKSNLTFVSAYPPSRPMHKSSEPSYLSKDCQVLQSYRGFLNLALILLVISNIRLIIDTVHRNGNIITKFPMYLSYLQQMEETALEHFPLLCGFLLVHVFVVYTYLIEYFLSKQSKIFVVNESLGIVLHFINCSLSLIVPMLLVWSYKPHPFFGAMLLVQVVITWMKIVSYIHANMDYRTSQLDSNAATLPLVQDLEQVDIAITYPQ